jgi:hypothetical protein
MIGEIKLTFEADSEQIDKATKIFKALIKSGGLWGVKGGKTVLHFDKFGTFMGIELDYWPWREYERSEYDKNMASGTL